MCHSEWKISTVVIRQCKYRPTIRYTREANHHVAWVEVREKPQCVTKIITVELHTSGLTGTTSHPDMQNIRITGFFLENRLHLQCEVGKNIPQMAILGYIFIYVQIKH
jgi:hypothetical protein